MDLFKKKCGPFQKKGLTFSKKRIDLASLGLPFFWKIPASNKEATTSNASGFFIPSSLPMNMEQIAAQFYNVTPIQKSSELVFALSAHCARFTRCSIHPLRD